MQTQNQKYIKWIPKKDVYTQKALKKNKADVFVNRASPAKTAETASLPFFSLF